MRNRILEGLLKEKVVSIVRGVAEKDVEAVVKALYAGGIRCVEFTFDYSSAEKLEENVRVINRISGLYREKMLVGAGTVLTPKEVDRAVEAGAGYIVSPNTDETVIRQTRKHAAVSVPGALTPTEIAAAYAAGADIVKVFPASTVGLGYFKSVRGPLGHIPLMATGGVTVENGADFLRAGCKGLGIGGNLVDLSQIGAGNFVFLEREARKYVDAVQNV